MTAPGTGGLPPPRLDQMRQPGSSALQAGGGSTVRARLVIVSGTDGQGVFIYEGAPALGNSPIAWATDSSVDPYGNVLPVTGPDIGVAGPGGAYLSMLPSLGGSAVPQLVFGPGGAQFIAQQPAVFAAIAGAGTTAERYALNLTTGWTIAPSGSAYQSSLFFQGAAPDGTADGFFAATIGAASGTPKLLINATPALATVGMPLAATQPGLGSLTETWHPMALQNGWAVGGSGQGDYKMGTDRRVYLRLTNVTVGTFADNTVVWTIPAGYAPTSAATQNVEIIVNYTTAPAFGSTPFLAARSNGTLTIQNLRGTPANISVTGSYPVD